MLNKIKRKMRYRVTHSAKLPKADLLSFFHGLEDRGYRPEYIVDIGANHAKWSEKALKVYPDCAFTLIEPQIEMKPFLDAFCARAKNSEWINAGMGNELGELPFTVIPDTVSSTFTLSESEAKRNGFEQRIVPLLTLDHLVSEVTHKIPDIVKIDAEGFECKIMEGAKSLIGETEIFLLEAPLAPHAEGWNSFSEIVAMMADLGYEAYEFTTFLKMPGDLSTRLVEVAFARRNGILRGKNPREEKAPVQHRRSA